MKFFKRLLTSLICLYLAMSSAHANIKVGTVIFYPPFVIAGNTGFDIQYMQLICQRLQAQCQFVPMDFNELYTALETNKIDLAIGGITIASAGSSNFIYSLPYILSKGSFLILKNGTIQTPNDLQGKKVGIIRGNRDGGVFYGYLEEHFTDQFQVMQYDAMEDLITALSGGDITAAFTHESTANYWKLNGGNQFTTIGPTLVVGEGIGIMATPANQALIQRINQQIVALEQDSTYLNLYNTYFSAEK
jgi:ABC-type amino acid transport substrate-binding protein